MKAFILALSATEVVHLLRAETKAANGRPELNTTCEKDYMIEEDFDHRAYGIRDEDRFDLATSVSTLTIEPRVESGYWILSTIVERSLGLVSMSDENKMAFTELTLDEFEIELRTVGRTKITVRVDTQTWAVKQDFDYWLAEMRARHPWKAQAVATGSEAAAGARPIDDGLLSSPSKTIYRVREAVGIFQHLDSLESTVDELENSGFDGAAISILATDVKAKERLDHLYRRLDDVEDNDRALQTAPISRDDRMEGKALAVGVPLYVGGVAGAWAIAAAGGALALAVAAVIALGIGEVSLGAFLAEVVARGHSARAQDQLRKGGFILWVDTPTPEAEKRATVALDEMNARDVHIHETHREWSIKNLP